MVEPQGRVPFTLVGCGVLRKEALTLMARNGWAGGTRFLPSSLHNDLDRLAVDLESALMAVHQEQGRPVVIYGACHPQMDGLLTRHRVRRTCGQNCIAQLLGFDRYMEELSQGAYFLLEDLALTWPATVMASFGANFEVIREIFQNSHEYVLAIRTPCSGEFTEAAETVARMAGLPLRWMDAGLDHLESVLAEAIQGA